jgi:hypothetical protein
MEKRNPALQTLLDSVHAALASNGTVEAAVPSVARIFTALESPLPASDKMGERLPVCAHLDAALGTARATSAPLARVADAFAKLEPHLTWRRRMGGPTASENFSDGHGNVMIVGPGGFEERDDVWVGASLMAPHVRYPDHNHKPEEVYLVLSRGEFRQGEAPWFEPGIGGTLFNVPNITHAMRSGDAPLFAVWCLWVDKQ